MARLTTIGETMVAAAVGVGPELEITKFVFANIPGLVHTAPEPANEPMPAPAHVVHQSAPTGQGIIDDNRVTYAKMLTTEIGNFSFNWIGLVYTHPVNGDQLVMFAYVPLTQKVKTAGASVGNVIVRNMVIEHLGIANGVPIVVSAESWMYDFSAEIAAISEELTELKERVTHKLVHNPNNYTAAGAAQRETIVFDQGQSKTVTLDAANLIAGDVIEVHKLAKAGRIDIVGTVNIVLPNGVSELNHWLPAGRSGVLIFECVAANQLRYAGGF
ncbi:phage tail protein [Rheinheimera texasensis]|uniref:phage tail-collar fiber domain-containing protein n=1 Tax=Rheinheimera texasensis TaxID=306205 RepID=UPI0032B14566